MHPYRAKAKAMTAAKIKGYATGGRVPEDIAETLVWMASRPPHVCIDEVVIKPTDQAAIHKLYRRPKVV